MLENILEWYYSTRLFQSRKQPLLHTCAPYLEAIFEYYRLRDEILQLYVCVLISFGYFYLGAQGDN